LLVLLQSLSASAEEPTQKLIDSNTIIRSLGPTPNVVKRGLQIVPGDATNNDAGGSSRITLDIRFGNDSDHLTRASEGQLDALGTALASAELARGRIG